MLLNRIYTLILCLILPCLVISQNSVGFSQDDFLEDINFLVDSVIDKVYVKEKFINSVSRRNISNEIDDLRKEVIAIEDINDFLILVKRIMHLTGDAHSGIERGSSLAHFIDYLTEEEKNGLLIQVDTAMLDVSDQRYNQLYGCLQKMYSNFKFFIHFKYLNGNYTNIVPIEYEEGIIDSGAFITKINGQNIHDWVSSHLDEYYMQYYDSENKRIYTNNLFNSYSIVKFKDTMELTFSDYNGKILNVPFNINERPKFVNERWITINLTKVKYFRKDKVLYIRLGDMFDSQTYLSKIRKFGSKNNIERVIIDIRNNPGGSDLVWKEIIEELIGQPFAIDLDVGVKNTSIVREYFGLKTDNEKIVFKGDTLLKLDMRMLETYIPSSSSICFDKKIIVIQDNSIFSSAGSFSTVAKNSDKFVTIGASVDLPIGSGITPMYFMLPNTKILVRIDPAIDITNANSYSDVYNEVEVEIKQDANDLFIWQTKNGNRWKRSFLFKNDAYYKKAIEIAVE